MTGAQSFGAPRSSTTLPIDREQTWPGALYEAGEVDRAIRLLERQLEQPSLVSWSTR
jgi:hypothetical protein